MGNLAKCQELLDAIPGMIDKQKKVGGKDLPTEVFIKKKRAHRFCLMSKYHSQRNHVVVFYQEQQKIATGSEDGYARAARISPAEGA